MCGLGAGVARGVIGGEVRHVDQSQPYFEFEVEKAATPLPSNQPPHYPEQLQAMNIEGTVLAEFVIDTLGRADLESFKVLKSTHEAFSKEVRAALARWRFRPAEIGGRKVRVLVQQPISFSIATK